MNHILICKEKKKIPNLKEEKELGMEKTNGRSELLTMVWRSSRRRGGRSAVGEDCTVEEVEHRHRVSILSSQIQFKCTHNTQSLFGSHN